MKGERKLSIKKGNKKKQQHTNKTEKEQKERKKKNWKTKVRKNERNCFLVACCLCNTQSASQGRIWLDKCTCCHTGIEEKDQTGHLSQSQYTDIGSATPSADPIVPHVWQGSCGIILLYVIHITWSGIARVIPDLPHLRQPQNHLAIKSAEEGFKLKG